ncbi:DUF1145 domain-containing protein [uncultured Paraglaciecola sp.]|uniref:DUF1145 domain-containing protein n=1 Tax=uncultured Paraglaciecola sp. TaxID=1765024 RepID=UPI002604ABE6|nr:DUF1145 domain-containing protein [uncultured Paraglaciecola sp.]
MKTNQLRIAKSIVVLVWILVIVAVVAPTQLPFAMFFQGVGIFLVVAHCIELVVFKRFIKQPSDVLHILLFGILHIKSQKLG